MRTGTSRVPRVILMLIGAGAILWLAPGDVQTRAAVPSIPVAALAMPSTGGGAPWDAQADAPGLSLLLTSNHSLLAPGGTLRLGIGAVNQGPPVPMDVYAVVQLPDGESVFSLLGGPVIRPGRLSQLAGLSPLAAGVTLPTGFAISMDDFLTYTFTGSEPAGLYRFYLAAVRPGALRDGRVDGGDLLALSTTEIVLGPPPVVTADPSRAASGLVGIEGGTVQTSGADGSVYTLAVPPGALRQPTTITLTPVTGVAGVPALGPLLAAVRGEPAGLQFDRPARLTIEVPGGVPRTAALGLLLADAGTGGDLVTPATGSDRLVIEMHHFSTVAVPRSATELARQFGQSGFAVSAAGHYLSATAGGTIDPIGARVLMHHLVRWYDTHVRVLLQAGQSENFGLLAGMTELQHWDLFRARLEGCCGDVPAPGGVIRGMLSSRATEGRTLAVTGLNQAFVRANDRCRVAGATTETRLGHAETGAALARLAEDFFVELAVRQILQPAATPIPSPDLAAHGLDGESVRSRICVGVVITDVIVPALAPGQSGTLTVVSGVSFDGGTANATSLLESELTTPIGSNNTTFRRTDASGRASFPVTATSSGEVSFLACAYAHSNSLPSLFFLLVEPCRSSSGGVIVTPPQVTLPQGGSQQFTAVVEDTPLQAVTWAVSGGGGTVTQSGLFTSNGAPGTFFVTATSVANPDSVGAAQITIGDFGTYEGNYGVVQVQQPTLFFRARVEIFPGSPGFIDLNLSVIDPLPPFIVPICASQNRIPIQSSGAFAAPCPDPTMTISGTATPQAVNFQVRLNSTGDVLRTFSGTRVAVPPTADARPIPR